MKAYGRSLYQRMRETFDFTPVLRTLMRDYDVAELRQAESLLEAFLQWFSMLPAVTRDKGYVMLVSDVDKMFHSFILNTSFYREFCLKSLDRFIEHNPLDQPDPKMPFQGFVDYTVQLLRSEYGDSLHPQLQKWESQAASGGWRISCLGACPSDIAPEATMARTGMARAPSGAPVIG